MASTLGKQNTWRERRCEKLPFVSAHCRETCWVGAAVKLFMLKKRSIYSLQMYERLSCRRGTGHRFKGTNEWKLLGVKCFMKHYKEKKISNSQRYSEESGPPWVKIGQVIPCHHWNCPSRVWTTSYQGRYGAHSSMSQKIPSKIPRFYSS